jgi:ArsR family transcriptional regulator
MTTPVPLATVLQMLKAAAESTRLRLLAVCADGELTVGELCQILRQSQPRVSRHLKLLSDANLVVRFREGHSVYYRTPVHGAGAEAVRQVLAWLDSSDTAVGRDRERSAKVRAQRAVHANRQLTQSGSEKGSLSALDGKVSELLHQVLLKETTESGPVGDLLDIGTGTGQILKWLAPEARRAIGLDISADALRVARTTVHSAGLNHCILQQGDMYELPFPPQSFDTITVDRVLSEAQSPAAVLEEAVRELRPGGRLIVIEDYDRLESRDPTGRRHGLKTLRDWLQAAGLDCERLRPIETDTQHLIVAVGRYPGHLNAAA